MRVSKDVRRLNPSLSKKQIRNARVKEKKEPLDYARLLADKCIAVGLPAPLLEVPFAKCLRLGYLADLGWVEERIIAEINGQIWRKGGHNSGGGLKRDYFKQSMAGLLGFRYFEFSPDMVEDDTAVTILLCAFGRLETFEQDWKALQPKQTRRK